MPKIDEDVTIRQQVYIGGVVVLSWNIAGVLPPVRPGMPGHHPDRSPYSVPLADLVEKFATSPERINILHGFLQLRDALHSIGISSGFQWIDGSFLENVELLEARPPADIDVVTYFDLPAGKSQLDLYNLNPQLFDQPFVKATYKVDHYPFVLGGKVDVHQVRQITYWYSMWSHRRDGLWKGFLQISLDPLEDIQALQILTSKLPAGATP